MKRYDLIFEAYLTAPEKGIINQEIMTKRTFVKARLLMPALTIFVVSLLMASCSSSRKSIPVEQGWDLLGEQKVNFVRDRDAITVYNTNRYTAIRFKVENKEIILNDLKIVYENGDKLAPTIADKIEANQYSREIEIGPEGKSIRSIEFKFRSTGNILKGRANVLVYGKRYVQPY